MQLFSQELDGPLHLSIHPFPDPGTQHTSSHVSPSLHHYLYNIQRLYRVKPGNSIGMDIFKTLLSFCYGQVSFNTESSPYEASTSMSLNQQFSVRVFQAIDPKHPNSWTRCCLRMVEESTYYLLRTHQFNSFVRKTSNESVHRFC